MPWDFDLSSGYAASGHFSLGFVTAVVLLQFFYWGGPEPIKPPKKQPIDDEPLPIDPPPNGDRPAPLPVPELPDPIEVPGSLSDITASTTSTVNGKSFVFYVNSKGGLFMGEENSDVHLDGLSHKLTPILPDTVLCNKTRPRIAAVAYILEKGDGSKSLEIRIFYNDATDHIFAVRNSTALPSGTSSSSTSLPAPSSRWTRSVVKDTRNFGIFIPENSILAALVVTTPQRQRQVRVYFNANDGRANTAVNVIWKLADEPDASSFDKQTYVLEKVGG